MTDLNQKLLVATECNIQCSGCSYKPYPLVWFHRTCFKLLEKTYDPSAKPTIEELGRFANATKRIYRPQYQEREEAASALEGLFSKHTKAIIHDSFSQDLLRRLPTELEYPIAKYTAPCWFLIVLGETRRLIEFFRNNREVQCRQFSLEKEIWISKIYYRGNFYVTRLDNRSPRAVDTSGQYRIELPSRLRKIILSTDSIGLRKIQLLDDASKLLSDGSPWYEILDVDESFLEACVDYDV